MNKSQQLRILKQVLQAVESEKPYRSYLTFLRVLLLVGVILIMAAYVLASVGYGYIQWQIVMGVFGGLFIGFSFAARSSINQWPLFKPHINKDSLENQIKALESL